MDSLDRPIHIHITAGNIHDISEAPALIAVAQGNSFIADKGYDSDAVVEAIEQPPTSLDSFCLPRCENGWSLFEDPPKFMP